jgi:hypothetical protein
MSTTLMKQRRMTNNYHQLINFLKMAKRKVNKKIMVPNTQKSKMMIKILFLLISNLNPLLFMKILVLQRLRALARKLDERHQEKGMDQIFKKSQQT